MNRVFSLFFIVFGIASAWVNPAYAADPVLSWEDNHPVKIDSAPGLRILWWNIHWGSLTANGPQNNFQNNLTSLIHSSTPPDVLAFAEYSHSALGENLFQELKVTYPFHQDFNYPGSSEDGVGVFSKFPFQVESIDPLGSRDLILLDLNVQGKMITLAPVHIEDQWRNFKHANSLLKTGEEVLVGTDNPVWDQIVAFRSKLESRLGERLAQKNFIMIGDFNSLKPGRAYDKIGFDLWDPVPGIAGTFPAKHSDDQSEFPFPVQIDHVFVSPGTDVKSAQILPLLGSDHYALETVLVP